MLAFAGTNGKHDWPTNMRQAFGTSSPQYEQAILLARDYASEGNIHFVGQSLGGGLAAAAAIHTGRTATIFNAAGLHPNTLNGLVPAPGSIVHFHSAYDVLQLANALTPGARIYGDSVSVGYGGWHPMSQMCAAMGCR